MSPVSFMRESCRNAEIVLFDTDRCGGVRRPLDDAPITLVRGSCVPDRSALLGAGSGGRDPKYTPSTRKNEGADS
jgi:hypothetical protein